MYWIETLPDDIAKGTQSKFVNGVPYTKIPYTQNYQPHATNIASYVLRTEDKKSAEWLLNNMDEHGCIWHRFKLPFYDDFPDEWVGGLAQGLTISALLRMYEKTDNKYYLDGAYQAYKGLKECIDPFGWINEYPGHPTILNGNLYAIISLFEISKHYKNAKKVFDRSLSAVGSSMDHYEIKFYGWSRYDLETKLPATKFYHQLHVDLLRVVSVLGWDHPMKLVLGVYQLRWAFYNDNWFYKQSANIERLWKLGKERGVLELIKRRRLRKEWLDENNKKDKRK